VLVIAPAVMNLVRLTVHLLFVNIPGS
jgi:hypothetical protein